MSHCSKKLNANDDSVEIITKLKVMAPNLSIKLKTIKPYHYFLLLLRVLLSFHDLHVCNYEPNMRE